MGTGVMGPRVSNCGAAASEFCTGLWGRWLLLSSLVARAGDGELALRKSSKREREAEERRPREKKLTRTGLWCVACLMMAGVPADTQGSTALKALATDKISTCILQSANLFHLLRNSSHTEAVAKLPKDLSLKVPNIKTTGELLEQMPSVIVALDSHLDNAIRSSSMLKEVRSILVDSPHSPPTPLPTIHFQDSSTGR